MNAWAPLSDELVYSSIWEEPDHVFRVFMGMMSLKGPDHVVRMDSYKLSRRMHMEHPVVLDALRVLESPDKRRKGQEYDGRRIEAVDGGWVFLNGQKYRDEVRLIMKRARDARAQANYRAKKAGKPLPYPSVRSQRKLTEAEQREELEAGALAQEKMKRLQEIEREHREAMEALNEVQEKHQLEGGE